MTNLNKDGWAYWPDGGSLLLELIIVDETSRANWFHPTERDIVQACADYGLPVAKTLEIIDSRDRKMHTVFINVPVYLKNLEEE